MVTWSQVTNGKNVEIEYDPSIIDRNFIKNVVIESASLQDLYVPNQPIIQGEQVFFSQNLISMTNLIFDTAGLLKKKGEYKLAWHLLDYLFNHFGGTWKQMLNNGLYVHGGKLWIGVCGLVWDWESRHNERLHKGTPYHFLAQTLLHIGDIDTGFTLVFNAIEEDKRTHSEVGNPEGYKSAPAYMFVTSVDNPNNSMYHLISGRIIRLQEYFIDYKNELNGNMNSIDFDNEFLHEPRLREVAFFFTYNLDQLIKQEKMTKPELLQNDFSKLRILDFVFNLCLIVDKVLGRKYSTHSKDTIANNVLGYCRDKLSLQEVNPSKLKNNLNINFYNEPDTVVPVLLNYGLTYKGQPADKKMTALVLTWYLRNIGGHTIKGQQTLITDFPNIVKQIMYALFIAIESL
jgi:hypothetical protein